jgi:hypothetical protein
MGCSDGTLPFRLSLAEDLTKAAAWQDPKKDSIPVDMQRLHFLAGSADATADACEACLASKPPFHGQRAHWVKMAIWVALLLSV